MSERDSFFQRDGFLKIVILRAAKSLLLACGCTLLCSTLALNAQTLARPGWAGSGLKTEAWWRNAIFYRIDVPQFQDSDGNGTGDLRGVIQRLDYLQSLGVDAIIVTAEPSDDSFTDLVREASPRHIRVIVSLNDSAHILDVGRRWLTLGAAGLVVEYAVIEANTSATPALLHDLRTLVNSFPGQRVFIARVPPHTQKPALKEAELVTIPIGLPTSTVPEILSPALTPPSVPPAGSLPLLETEPVMRLADRTGYSNMGTHPDEERSIGLQKIAAAELFTNATAVLLHSGQEIGVRGLAENSRIPMQWTPTNITPPPATPPEPVAETKPEPPSDPNVYGAFKPYVPPKPAPKPLSPDAPPDPATLPGFTTGKPIDTPASNAATANVAVENSDPVSLLNFYRRLAQLHHDNPSLRSGAIVTLDKNAQNALAWIHLAPASTRTAGTVVVAANLTDQPMQLPLEDDFKRLHLRNGSLRPLLASWTADAPSLSSYNLILPPHSVYIGELYH